MPSEITGEKAERTKARSISLQTWIRPFWMTVSVTGSRFDMAYDYHNKRCRVDSSTLILVFSTVRALAPQKALPPASAQSAL